MKSIKYFLIPLLILALFSFKQKADERHTLLIRAVDENVPAELLSRSSEIISKRLKDLSTGKFEMTILDQKKQIRIIFDGDWDLPVVSKLIEHRGKIEFYLTYDQQGLRELLNGDDKLFTLLTERQPEKSGAKIGCTNDTGVSKVNEYLNTLTLRQKCKFAWTQDFNKSALCLYALRLTGQNGPVITGNDISGASYDQDRIRISLKPEATSVFAQVTRQNLNSDMAIVLDDNVIAAPRIMNEIDSGKIEITGNFTKTEAGYISAILNNGPLPVDFMVVK
jgi:preprotein translocase subunit SecD